jgi:four helix bundle protein
MAQTIKTHRDLNVYQMAFEAAMRIFELTKSFPKEETYSLTDQIRRSSRSVCSNIAEAWRKRRYEAAFVSKLNDAEAEAAETQTWLEFSAKCGYLDAAEMSEDEAIPAHPNNEYGWEKLYAERVARAYGRQPPCPPKFGELGAVRMMKTQ